MKRAMLVLSILLVVPLVAALAGCGSGDATGQTGSTTSSAVTPGQPATSTTTGIMPAGSATPTSAAEPTTTEQARSTTTTAASRTAWVITINDGDSYTEGDMTYTIDLELTATNPSSTIAGTYTGSATANTSVNGTVNGLPLNASSNVNSSKLEFTLEDPLAGGALAPLTPDGADDLVYKGSGTIVMQAVGSGSIGPAGGGFQNTSGQQIEVTVKGSAATLSVVIEGHKYTFEGTISGA